MIKFLIITCLWSFLATVAMSAPVTTDDPPYKEYCGLWSNITEFEEQLSDFYKSRALDRVAPLLDSIALLRRSVLDRQQRLMKGPPNPRNFTDNLVWQVSKSGCKTVLRYLELNAAELTTYQKGLGDLRPDMNQELAKSLEQFRVNDSSLDIKLATLGDRIDKYNAQRNMKARSEIIQLFFKVISESREIGNAVYSHISDYVIQKYKMGEVLSVRDQSVAEYQVALAHEIYIFLAQQLINFETTT